MGTHARGEKNRSQGRWRRANTSAPPKRVEAGDGTGGGKEGGRGLGGGCKTDMQSALLGEVADIKGGGPLQGGEEGFKGRVSPSQSNKVSLFRNKRHETEQSEKSQSGGTTNSIGTKTEVVNGEDGSVQVSTHTVLIRR